MMFKKISLGLILFSFNLIAHAEQTDTQSKPCYNYFISLSGGPGWTNAGKSQTIAFEPDVVNTYVPKNLTNSHVMINGELFLGVQESFFDHIQSQFGLALYASSLANLNGYMQVDGNPNFQNYAYQYKINHEHIQRKILTNYF